MIHYSLRCEAGHPFDGWFSSSAAFERQSAASQVGCPACGSTEVQRALMAPALARGAAAPHRSAPEQALADGASPSAPAAGEANIALVDERSQKMRAMLRAMRETVLEHGTDVGRAFPEEARKIHYGEVAPRGIFGQADRDEARALIEEGVGILPLPAPDEAN